MSADTTATEVSGTRKRHWGRWALLVLALGIGVLAALPSLLSGRAERQIERRIQQYRSAGEPVSALDLATPPVVDEENAVVELGKAAGLVAAYGNANANWRTYELGDMGYPFTASERPLAQAVVRDNAAVFDLLDAAMAKEGFYWPNQPTSPLISWLLPELSPQRGLARFLGTAAQVEHDRGDDAAALLDVRRTLFVATAMDHHPQCIIVSLVATGIRAIACERVFRIAPDLEIGTARPSAAPDDVAAVIGELLDEADANEALHRGMLAERVLGLDTTGAVMAGRLNLSSIMRSGSPSSAPLIGSPLGRYVSGPWIRADLILMLDAETQMAESLRSPDWPAARAKIEHLHDPIRAEPARHFWAGMLLPAMDRAVESAYRSRADRRMAAVALAIRWYAVEHGGRLPRSLDALVPRYLPAVPRDPFAAGGTSPLRYIADDPDPRVYSVGRNGIDDGGSDQPSTSDTKRSDSWWNLDAVVHLRRQPRDLNELPAGLRD